jgi:hypothetical protein
MLVVRVAGSMMKHAHRRWSFGLSRGSFNGCTRGVNHTCDPARRTAPLHQCGSTTHGCFALARASAPHAARSGMNEMGLRVLALMPWRFCSSGIHCRLSDRYECVRLNGPNAANWAKLHSQIIFSGLRAKSKMRFTFFHCYFIWVARTDEPSKGPWHFCYGQALCFYCSRLIILCYMLHIMFIVEIKLNQWDI